MIVALLLAIGCCSSALMSRRYERALRCRTAKLIDSPHGMSRGPGGGTTGSAVRQAVVRMRGGLLARCGRSWRREPAAALTSTLLGWLMVGGAVGLLVGATGGGALCWWLRRRTEATPAESAQADAVNEQLPLVAELMAACLAAGSAPEQAAGAVGGSVGGPLGDQLRRVATELRLGGEPAVVWERFGFSPGCGALARCMERAGTAGVPAVDSVTRLAGRTRADRTRASSARARRAAVRVAGPLGFCFLPAFLAVGVAPVVLGLTNSLL
ncbi:hypothetical protein AN216_23630 [Streptomyces oceani]|uniref:Type II secretion system protein GspF domain-containing protein n=2 Tax=Streptomyces oceani TaxID=1075402 RepID=A0A1E7JW65_9ACTN|nr:hypothetical protein AN216_23630 [Streptomyces oceani]